MRYDNGKQAINCGRGNLELQPTGPNIISHAVWFALCVSSRLQPKQDQQTDKSTSPRIGVFDTKTGKFIYFFEIFLSKIIFFTHFLFSLFFLISHNEFHFHFTVLISLDNGEQLSAHSQVRCVYFVLRVDSDRFSPRIKILNCYVFFCDDRVCVCVRSANLAARKLARYLPHYTELKLDRIYKTYYKTDEHDDQTRPKQAAENI